MRLDLQQPDLFVLVILETNADNTDEPDLPDTLFLHENVQTEAVSIHFEHFAANRGHFYFDFGS